MTDEIKVGRLARDLFGAEVVVTREADKPTRITFPASSETPVERWFGTEVLRHDEKSIRMDRLKGGAAPLLFNHDWNDPVGMIDGARVKDGRLYVDAHFFDTERAKEVASMVDGGMRNVSIGYELYEVTEDTKANRFTATDWGVLEVSFATVPADPSVGVGRAKEDAAPVRVIRSVSQLAAPAVVPKENPMSGEQQAAAGANAEELARLAAQQAEANVSAVDREKTRIRAVEALGKSNNIDARKVEGWIRGGTSLDKIADEILAVHEERGKARPTSAADLGLSRSEQKRYSVFRLMRLMSARPGDVGRLQEEAAYEIECSEGVAKRLGRSPDGFFVPGDILRRPIDPEAAAIAAQRHNRAMTVVPGASGGYLVETENMGFIEILRNTMVLSAMGARQLSGLVGNITVPRQTGATSVTWQAGETTAATASDQTLGQLSMTPKTAIIVTEVGRTLMLQSNPSAESMVMADLAQSTALGVDYAGINGTGGAQPIGILNTPGITTGQDAGTATQAKLLAFQSVAATANALLGRPGYVARPAGAAVLAGRPRFTNSDTPMWDGNILRGTVAGFPAMSSMQMPADASLLFGSWDSVVVGEWGVLELSLNPYQNFNAGVVGIRAIYSVDVMVRYPQAFVYSSDLS